MRGRRGEGTQARGSPRDTLSARRHRSAGDEEALRAARRSDREPLARMHAEPAGEAALEDDRPRPQPVPGANRGAADLHVLRRSGDRDPERAAGVRERAEHERQGSGRGQTPGNRASRPSSTFGESAVTITCAPFVASNVRSHGLSAMRPTLSATVSVVAAAATSRAVSTACSGRPRRPVRMSLASAWSIAYTSSSSRDISTPAPRASPSTTSSATRPSRSVMTRSAIAATRAS